MRRRMGEVSVAIWVAALPTVHGRWMEGERKERRVADLPQGGMGMGGRACVA